MRMKANWPKLQRREVILVESEPDPLRLDFGSHRFRKGIVNTIIKSPLLDQVADFLFQEFLVN